MIGGLLNRGFTVFTHMMHLLVLNYVTGRKPETNFG